LKNITVGLYLKQDFVVDTFTRCQAKLNESRFRVLTRIALRLHSIVNCESRFIVRMRRLNMFVMQVFTQCNLMHSEF